MEAIGQNLSDNLENELKKGYKKYSIDFKLKVINLVHLNIIIHSISNKLGIDRKLIRDQVNKKATLSEIPNKYSRFRINKSSGIVKIFTDLEEDMILELLSERRRNNLTVSTKSLISYASSLKDNFSNNNLAAKLKQAYRFIKRKGLSIRRFSHLGQRILEDKNIIVNKFRENVINKRRELNIEEDEDYRVINLDETAIFQRSHLILQQILKEINI